MKKTGILIIVLGMGLVIASCGFFSQKTERTSSDEYMAKAAQAPMPAPRMAAGGLMMEAEEAYNSGAESEIDYSVSERKIIYTARVNIEVKSCLESIAKIKEMVKVAKGYIADTEIEEHDEGRKSAVLTIKVPAGDFDKVLADLPNIGRVTAQETHSDDITEAYVDVEARLTNAYRMEKRLVDLLEKKTTKLADMLEVEKELGRVREKIERFEGKKRFFDNRVSLSTITVYLTEPYKFTSSIFDPIKEAFETAGEVLMKSVAAIVIFLAVALPWAVLIGIVVYIIIILIRRRSRRKKA